MYEVLHVFHSTHTSAYSGDLHLKWSLLSPCTALDIDLLGMYWNMCLQPAADANNHLGCDGKILDTSHLHWISKHILKMYAHIWWIITRLKSLFTVYDHVTPFKDVNLMSFDSFLSCFSEHELVIWKDHVQIMKALDSDKSVVFITLKFSISWNRGGIYPFLRSPKTAFVTPDGCFQFREIPFGMVMLLHHLITWRKRFSLMCTEELWIAECGWPEQVLCWVLGFVKAYAVLEAYAFGVGGKVWLSQATSWKWNF